MNNSDIMMWAILLTCFGVIIMAFFKMAKATTGMNGKKKADKDVLQDRIAKIIKSSKETKHLIRSITFSCPPEQVAAFYAWVAKSVEGIEALKAEIPGLQIEDRIAADSLGLDISSMSGISDDA